LLRYFLASFKKEEHRKNTRFYNKAFNFSTLTLGSEFSDENFLSESLKGSGFAAFSPITKEKPKKKPLENVEIVHKSSSKDFQRTQIIEAKTGPKRLFNEIELFEDIFHGKYYQFPRNCLDFYDNNIDSYEVVSQNNCIYNLEGKQRRLKRGKLRKNDNWICQIESHEDNFKVCKEESNFRKSTNFLEKPEQTSNFQKKISNFSQEKNENLFMNQEKISISLNPNFFESSSQSPDFERTTKKEEISNKTNAFTIRKSIFDKENFNEFEPKEPDQILVPKKTPEKKEKMSQKAKNYLESDINMNNSEVFPDVSRISSIKMSEKQPYVLVKSVKNLNTDELNNLSEQIFLKMSKNKGIFEEEEEFRGSKMKQNLLNVSQKIKGNESSRSSFFFVDKSKIKGKSQNKIFEELGDGDKSF